MTQPLNLSTANHRSTRQVAVGLSWRTEERQLKMYRGKCGGTSRPVRITLPALSGGSAQDCGVCAVLSNRTDSSELADCTEVTDNKASKPISNHKRLQKVWNTLSTAVKTRKEIAWVCRRFSTTCSSDHSHKFSFTPTAPNWTWGEKKTGDNGHMITPIISNTVSHSQSGG